MRFLCCILTLIVGGNMIILGDEAPEPERLVQLRAFWKSASDRATKPFDDQYLNDLKQLQIRLTKSGKLDEALETKEEIERVEKANLDPAQPVKKAVSAVVSQELIALNKKWLEDRQKPLVKIDRTYQTALEKLMTKLSKAGDLEGAVKVREESALLSKNQIDRGNGKPTKAKSAFERALVNNTWSWTHESDGANHIIFHEGGDGIFGRWTKKQMRWRVIKDRTVEIEVNHGDGPVTTILVWDRALKSYQGTDFPPSNTRKVRGSIKSD